MVEAFEMLCKPKLARTIARKTKSNIKEQLSDVIFIEYHTSKILLTNSI